MKKLKVLQLTDAVGGELDYYSKQLETAIEGKHISETYYFLTDNNILIDIDKDIDTENTEIKEAIALGAVIKIMYFVEDESFSDHIYDFNTIGVWDGVEYAEEHGIVFENKEDAVKYEKYVWLVNDKVEVNGYDVIEKENAIRIVEETPVKEIAELLINKQKNNESGAICYLDLEIGIIKVVEDTHKLEETNIIIAKLYRDKIFNGDAVEGEYVKEYNSAIIASMLKLDNFRQAVEEFYNEWE
ncbi:MAG: hypothetical protein LLF98_11095 [Clostridium sp.]|uniref:hypothetical protein n=1 Tax=Clostridium sp. TaxID=1506 RepID=UPI0025B82D25|nr:hypothetical protein [Clostridium sp.]MCE5221775.1 hypothetical protein [Clostridium sp.]